MIIEVENKMSEQSKETTESDSSVVRPASDTFKRAVCHSVSIVVECEHCSRNYFDSEQAECFEEGELEELLLKAENKPDKYIDTDSTHWGHIDGKQAVVNCCCNVLRKYENFIWDHRYIISDYLKDRIRENHESAKRDLDNIGKLKV